MMRALAAEARAAGSQPPLQRADSWMAIVHLQEVSEMGDIKEQEIRRWKEREKKDLDVEKNRGERPLEGFSGSGAGTSWSAATDEGRASAEEHGRDKEKSEKASEEQAE